ncbi:hypothetical protein RO3G_01064 [Rhizopus delemar RA 99-880]|uniref:HBS1-like protein N-terminal domain-containing protein n=1 Tax=Rhizopus delemar (strain RA 99-880 / ATCC MYA-4621 / FGSC 9543 / NRRL 43880) TaxID=246409 RepID=I1BJI0_RHIO9|nr:hypothetical protein RO3G_01064 [Rhizopus delemar RA 99-880]|eukprot:EIE76360.1 hypothetical protein RO3G_01064 [Rhizopus delemar RA 99-880]
MSRHRAVRNLDVDGILEEDYYQSESENDFDESELTNEDLDLLDEGLEYIESVIGENNGILSSRQIKEALWYYYLNKEETLEWALDEISKAKALEEKKKLKEKAKKAFIRQSKDNSPPRNSSE